MRTTFHCAFDESLKDRRCGLLDFVLRPRKAGPGATRDEERIARLEGELYDLDGGLLDDIIDDTLDGFRMKAKTAGQQKRPSPQPAHSQCRRLSSSFAGHGCHSWAPAFSQHSSWRRGSVQPRAGFV